MRSRTTFCAIIAATFVLAALPASATGSTLAKSTFGTDADEWQSAVVPNNVGDAEWNSAYGNPPGCIVQSAEDNTPYEVYFSAPYKFLGGKIASKGGSFTFDLIFNRTDSAGFINVGTGNVYIHSTNGVVLRHTFGDVVANDPWRNFSVPLSRHGWKDTRDFHGVTTKEMNAVLASIEEINVDIYNPEHGDPGVFFVPVRSWFAIDNVKMKQS